MGEKTCSDANFINNYGVGHPSALVMNGDAAKRIWLFYFDSKGDWSQRGVFLAKSRDGFHFEQPVKTNLPNDASVKYYDGPFGAWNHVFVATTVIGKGNGFLISNDGIHWIPERSMINIGDAVSGHCAAPGPGTLVGDPGGRIASMKVSLLSAEGFYGKRENGDKMGCYSGDEDVSRGSTWKIYLLQGEIVPQPADH